MLRFSLILNFGLIKYSPCAAQCTSFTATALMTTTTDCIAVTKVRIYSQWTDFSITLTTHYNVGGQAATVRPPSSGRLTVGSTVRL